MEELKPPKNRKLFYRSIEDDEASDWVKKLAAGPNPRKSRRRRDYPSTPPVALDGYQLILRAMHDLGSPQEVPVTEIKRHIGEKLNLDPTALNALALETKVRNLSLLASRDTKDALDRATANMILSTTDDGGDEASEEVRAHAELLASEAIPQPVFEVQGEDNQATIHVLDPYVSYMLMWHPEAIIEGGRK